jgi:predicted TIM-barrel fold metal-dependent hydrolase
MVIDFHTHIFPDKVARAVQADAEKYLGLPAFAPATQEGLRRKMDESGTDLSIVLAVAPHPKFVSSINEWLLKIRDDRVQFFGAIHPDMDGWEDELRKLKDNGVRGLKLNSLLQRIRPDDPGMYKIYEKAGRDFIFLFHAGGSSKPKDPPEETLATPARIAKVLNDFPGMTVIAAHFGGNHALEEMREHLLGKTVYLDTSYPPDLTILPPDEVATLVRSHGVDMVLFGTDFPWETQERCLRYFRSLPLAEEEKEKILGGNARKLLFGNS